MRNKHLVWVIGFVCSTVFAGSWNTVLQQGWTPPESYFIYGYSEFTPALELGVRAYETRLDREACLKEPHYEEFVGANDTFRLSAYEEERHLKPGLELIAEHWLADLQQLVEGHDPGGDTLKGIPVDVTRGNPYWPADIPKHPNQPIVSLTPLTLSRVMEDLGRLHPWAIYGGAELDWEMLFFSHTLPADHDGWLCDLLKKVYDAKTEPKCDLKALGLRVVAKDPKLVPAAWRNLKGSHYLLTFQPYGEWAPELKTAYKEGKLQAIPHPATLLFSGSPHFNRMKHPEAKQIPLAMELSRFSKRLAQNKFYGLRVLDITRKRHRFSKPAHQRNSPDQIGSASFRVNANDDDPENPFNYIFQPLPKVMGIYGKPIARNVQLWGMEGPLEGKWLLDGPKADKKKIDEVRAEIEKDNNASRLHHRNYFPVMRIHGYDARWYRPFVAYTKDGKFHVDTTLKGSVRLSRGNEEQWFPVALPKDAKTELQLASIKDEKGNPETTARNLKKLLEYKRLLGDKPIPKDLARALWNPGKLPEKLPAIVEKAVSKEPTPSLTAATYSLTVNDGFDQRYWDQLYAVSEGTFKAKNNTDCAGTDDDPLGKELDKKHCKKNHLPDLLNYLKDYYEKLNIPTFVHEFEWKVDFDIPWWEGLKVKQQNLIAVVHGTDNKPHSEAVIMGDHYDTAHMGDHYDGEDYQLGKKVPSLKGHRHASKGSDDNHSATVALMEAALALKELKLKKDVWLVHITGEEFPADGLGSRALAQALIEGKPLTGRANPKIASVIILDMVGHSTDRDTGGLAAPSIFQMAPGRGTAAARLAYTAHRATETWNRSYKKWNEDLGRALPWTRFKYEDKKPKVKNPLLVGYQGEVRTVGHFRSSLYQTDIQIFTDVGFPAMLFMENYDVERKGYHDTLDNMTMIDLDYARGVSAIAIETVAQEAL